MKRLIEEMRKEVDWKINMQGEHARRRREKNEAEQKLE